MLGQASIAAARFPQRLARPWVLASPRNKQSSLVAGMRKENLGRSAPHSKILSGASRVQLKAWEPASSLNSQQPNLTPLEFHRAGWDFRNNQDSISVPLKNRFIRWEHPAAETVNMLYI
jgi:hypothetical protein